MADALTARFPGRRQRDDDRRSPTIVAANVGGAIIPASFADYPLLHGPIEPGAALLAIGVVAAAARLFSHLHKGIGVTLPLFVGPLCAALVSLALDPAHAAPLACVSGTLGVLIGADLLRLGAAVRRSRGMVSIGGAGTSEGISLTGVVAVFLV